MVEVDGCGRPPRETVFVPFFDIAGIGMAPASPPTIPHTLQLRENCLACHGGAASRVEIRTSHPERPRCRQCHVPESGG